MFTGCIYRWACGWSQLAWSKVQQLHGIVLSSSHEPSELLQWLCHDDCTIKIVLVLVTVIIIVVVVVVMCSADCQCGSGERKRWAGTAAHWCTGLFCWTSCHDQGSVEHRSRLVVCWYISGHLSGCLTEPGGNQRSLPGEPHQFSCCKEGLGMFSLQSMTISIFLYCVLQVKTNVEF